MAVKVGVETDRRASEHQIPKAVPAHFPYEQCCNSQKHTGWTRHVPRQILRDGSTAHHYRNHDRDQLHGPAQEDGEMLAEIRVASECASDDQRRAQDDNAPGDCCPDSPRLAGGAPRGGRDCRCGVVGHVGHSGNPSWNRERQGRSHGAGHSAASTRLRRSNIADSPARTKVEMRDMDIPQCSRCELLLPFVGRGVAQVRLDRLSIVTGARHAVSEAGPMQTRRFSTGMAGVLPKGRGEPAGTP
jgi:hypothetical protein